MICPICKKKMRISDVAETNMEHYHNVVVVRTLCCKKLVRCYPKFSYTAEAVSRAGKDDWGN